MSIDSQYKYFIVYNQTTGKITRSGTVDASTDHSELPEALDVLYLTEAINVNHSEQSIDLETMSIVDKPIVTPLPVVTATWDTIKAYRERFIAEPIDTDEGLLHADSESMQRLESADEHYVDLPKKKAGKVRWKMADNTIVELSILELKKLNKDVRKAKAIRTAKLFEKAEVLNEMDPKPTLEFIADINNWIEP